MYTGNLFRILPKNKLKSIRTCFIILLSCIKLCSRCPNHINQWMKCQNIIDISRFSAVQITALLSGKLNQRKTSSLLLLHIPPRRSPPWSSVASWHPSLARWPCGTDTPWISSPAGRHGLDTQAHTYTFCYIHRWGYLWPPGVSFSYNTQKWIRIGPDSMSSGYCGSLRTHTQQSGHPGW